MLRSTACSITLLLSSTEDRSSTRGPGLPLRGIEEENKKKNEEQGGEEEFR
jgi:hypothetical protein